jgi:hypothetical protein
MNQDLANHVRSIVDNIENGMDSVENEGSSMDAFEYLSDALDIEYIVTGKREVLGARVLVAFGGPNIWINTRTKQVEGFWWSDKCIMPYESDSIGLDDAIETLWSC